MLPPISNPPPLIVIDAGHGGRDPGAAGVGGVLEKNVVLTAAHRLAERLAARLPVTVLLTRTDDSFVPIDERLARQGEAATLFISLHANASTDARASGIEVFYGGGALRPTGVPGPDPRAARFGRYVAKALSTRLGGLRGEARPGEFRVLTHNPTPGTLVEIGYLTHHDDAALAQSDAYQAVLADALIDAVAAFLRGTAPVL
jgi:N-acetylmuramoyl-L-alanine amidase